MTTASPVLVLGSASPARLATLRSAGVDPLVVVSGVDESQVGDLAPVDVAGALAGLKAQAVAARAEVPAGALVLGCDSVLELDGQALGKPGDPEEAARRWREMRGRTGVLHSGHSLHDTATGRVVEATVSTTVHFADVTDDETLHVAGGFTIDGLGGAFVSGIEGDHHNVVGLSLPRLRLLVAELGHSWTALWSSARR